MNSFYKQISGLMFCVMLVTAVPTRGMENEVNSVDSADQLEMAQESSIVWYKDHALQIAAVMITTAAAIYAFAVYKGKASSPAALLAGLFCAHVAKKIATQPSEDNVSIKSNNNPVIVAVDNNSGNDTQVTIVVPEENKHKDAQDNQLNKESNKEVTILKNDVPENTGSSQEINEEIDNTKPNSQNTEIKITEQKEETTVEPKKEITEQKDVVVTSNTIVQPEIGFAAKAKSLFAQLRNGARLWVTSEEM